MEGIVAAMPVDAIWTRARVDLVLQTKQGHPDLFLWEHSARVAHNALHIATLATTFPSEVDESAVIAASLYHDAAWAVRCREGEIDRTEILLTPTTDTGWEQGASLLERSLAGVLSPTCLDRAAAAIRSLSRSGGDMIEGQIVAEANNLDEFGVLALWTVIRRGTLEGKGVQAVIDMWERKKEYRFWTARLHDSFRFKPVRELAEERLKRFERVMEELREQHQGRDVERSAAIESKKQPADNPAVS